MFGLVGRLADALLAVAVPKAEAAAAGPCAVLCNSTGCTDWACCRAGISAFWMRSCRHNSTNACYQQWGDKC